MMNQNRRTRRGLTLIDVTGAVASVILTASIGLHGIQEARDAAKFTTSLSNLRHHGIAHATYASEWNGRQWTTCPDGLSRILKDHHGGAFQKSYKGSDLIPPVPLGFNREGTHLSTAFGYAVQPFWYTENCSLGAFRAYHTKPFNMYFNNKVYDPIFWAPLDDSVQEDVVRWYDDPGEWPLEAQMLYLPTYCAGVSAMVDPGVFRAESKGGFQDPLALEHGFRTPALMQARFPDQKTHMLEHYWLQDRPSKSMPNTGGVPWFFNAGLGSKPATLYYDGHVNRLHVVRVVDSNEKVTEQGGDPLWIDEKRCFSGGYFTSYAHEGEVETSFHLFTADGIRGRDVID